MLATVCPSHHRLSDFLLGRLDELELDDVGQHLDQCPACQQAAGELERIPDALVERLRGPLPDDWSAPDGELSGLLASARQVPQAEAPPRRIRDYLLLEKLGQGGMGVVYRARHERLARDVALKLLPPDRCGDAKAESRFEREMRAIGQLQHDNIVAALDAGVAEGAYYLAMELVDGCDASQLVERLGPLPAAEACELVRQAALGLECAHRQGMVHRDLKPSNLLVTRSGTVKVADLGLALFAHTADAAERTPASQVLGTLDYVAPEQAEGATATPRSDLYSLGATLFKLLAGRAPFSASASASPLETLLALRERNAPPLGSLRPDVPPELESLVKRLLEKDPERRPASAAELAAALAPFCPGANLARHVGLALAGEATGAIAPQQAVSATSVATRRSTHSLRRAAIAALVLLPAGIALFAALNQQGDEADERGSGNSAAVAQKSGESLRESDAARVKAAQDRQREWAERLNLKVQQTNSLGMQLTLIPPGEFAMGSTATETAQAIAIERRQVPTGWPMHYFIRKVEVEMPQHQVKLTRPFLMGTHEVTVDEWDAFAKDSGYRRAALGEPERYGKDGFGRSDTRPKDGKTAMTFVTWDDASAFCNWLGAKEGKTYRLPTEAEWEYACRAGTTTTWFTGDDAESLRDYAWTLQTCGKGRDLQHENDAEVPPRTVGQKKPNAFGLHDMIGNAWEWCRDHFRQDYYAFSPAEDPPGPKVSIHGPFNHHTVLRGGGNGFRENEARSATRWFLPPGDVRRFIGFRVVCEVASE